MGLFDLDEYGQRKKRADESATQPRALPVVHADVHFNGQKQRLRFEPVLIDGYHVFISFRPESAPPAHTLMVGETVEKQMGVGWTERVVQGLTVDTTDAFQPENWLGKAKKNLEAGYFGRLRLENEQLSPKSRRWDDTAVFQFFSSSGLVDEEDYIIERDAVSYYPDGSMSDDDIIPDFAPWAPAADAPRLLIDLDESAFNAYLAKEQANPNGRYGLFTRWKNLSFQERHDLLPQCERDIETEVMTLMKAVVWSDLAFTEPSAVPLTDYEYERPFWRCSRFWINPEANKGVCNLHEHFYRRITRIWPYISSHFTARYPALRSNEDVHPLVLSWMSCRGAYLVEFDTPNAHEHLESRLILRDFLLETGVSLDEIEAELSKKRKRR